LIPPLPRKAIRATLERAKGKAGGEGLAGGVGKAKAKKAPKGSPARREAGKGKKARREAKGARAGA
jgi:hypothetical protein